MGRVADKMDRQLGALHEPFQSCVLIIASGSRDQLNDLLSLGSFWRVSSAFPP
jgi:hypothetical protein